MPNRPEVSVKNGSQWFMNILKEKGIQFVFGTSGSAMLDIQDAMVKVKPPKWIQGLHEFPTVNAASGYALASEKAGVALIDRAVGTQNAAGGFYGAFMNGSPTVIFATRNVPGVPIPKGELEGHYVSTQAQMVSPWLKWFTENVSLETLPEDIEKAFLTALEEQQGPTYVTLRQDLMAQEVKSARFLKQSKEWRSQRIPDEETCRKVIDEILRHDFPQIIVSHSGRHADTVGPLVEFAHTLGVAVSDRRVFMSYPTTDILHTGFVGFWEARSLPKADLVIPLEMGVLPNLRFPENLEIIDIASDPIHRHDTMSGGDYGGAYLQYLIKIQCDTTPTLQKLIKLSKDYISKDGNAKIIKERIQRAKEIHDRLSSEAREKAQSSYGRGILDDWSIGYVLNKNWSRQTVWVDGSISSKGALVRAIELDKPGSYFCNPSGHMGVAVGMSYGVAMAHRSYSAKDFGSYFGGEFTKSDRVVICTEGDGDAIMGNLDSALWTCKHYGIGVLYIILNNASWGFEWPLFERTTQRTAYDADDYEFVDLDKPRIDFSLIGKAFDLYSKRVETIKEFEIELQRALEVVKKGEPALVEVKQAKMTGEKTSNVL